MKFDAYEQELLDAIEASQQFKRVADYEDEIMMAKAAAKNFLNKTKNINVRIPEYDIIQLKRKSAELSIPYQTILSSLIHQYVTGRIKPVM